jgi:hypothetical protein
MFVFVVASSVSLNPRFFIIIYNSDSLSKLSVIFGITITTSDTGFFFFFFFFVVVLLCQDVDGLLYSIVECGDRLLMIMMLLLSHKARFGVTLDAFILCLCVQFATEYQIADSVHASTWIGGRPTPSVAFRDASRFQYEFVFLVFL